jgi:hypothetical protein
MKVVALTTSSGETPATSWRATDIAISSWIEFSEMMTDEKQLD